MKLILGMPVVRFRDEGLGSLLDLKIRKKGTLIIKGFLGNLAPAEPQQHGDFHHWPQCRPEYLTVLILLARWGT